MMISHMAVTYLLFLLICDVGDVVDHLLRGELHISIVERRVFGDLFKSREKEKGNEGQNKMI